MTSTPTSTSNHTGHPLLLTAYRPFFLAATIHGAIIMLFWLLDYLQGFPMESLYGRQGWHAHEMLHGFTLAFLAGYLLHAVKNWTGVTPLSRRALLGLVLLWLSGRFLHFYPDLVPAALWAAPDLLFPLLLTATIAASLIQTRTSHAYAVIEVLTLVCLVSIADYWKAVGLLDNTVTTAPATLLTTIAVLAVLAGKLIPGFAERTLGLEIMPTRHAAAIENTAIASIYLLTLLLFVTGVQHWLGAVVALVAAVAHGLRLKGWYRAEIWRHPQLWVLYSGYGWISLGFALVAAGMAGIVPLAVGWHALGIGGIGLMAAGLMTRVIFSNELRHRPEEPDSWVVLGYLLLNVATAALAILPWLIAAMTLRWTIVAAAGWIVAMAILGWRFFQPLTTAQDS